MKKIYINRIRKACERKYWNGKWKTGRKPMGRPKKWLYNVKEAIEKKCE